MRKLGLIGGLSWHSTVHYYQSINEQVQQILGQLNSPELVIESLNLQQIVELQNAGEWESLAQILVRSATNLKNSGAEAFLMCSNTIHSVADLVQEKVEIPLIHIADPTAKAIIEQNLNTVGILATKITMENTFYTSRLEQSGIQSIVPEEGDRRVVDSIIFNELCHGSAIEQSKQRYIEIIDRMIEIGAQGVILGCTEIGLLINPEDVSVPIFDTTALHVEAAVDFLLSDQNFRDYSRQGR